MKESPKIGLRSATALVIANMIGAGIFTTTGYQVSDLGDPVVILVLWALGGVLAFCGALCYAELGAAMPHSGGEYVYLRETLGPLFGFMSAFVSLVAGFSAPIAAALKGFVSYTFHPFPSLEEPLDALFGLTGQDLLAALLVWILVAIHMRHLKVGFGFNDLVTLFKVAGIGAILVAAVMFGKGDWSHLTTPAKAIVRPEGEAFWMASATSLVFVMFCYTGWNASAYVASELREPQKKLPQSLLLGTLVVMVLYLGLNMVYFYGAGSDALAGEAEVGLLAARNLFGPVGSSLVTLVMAVSILASASAMVIAGPRVYFAFAKDFKPLSMFASINSNTGIPSRALLLQGAVTTLLVFSGRIDQIQQYAGFTLGLFSCLAVSCVFVLRWKAPNLERPFRTWGYPVTPLLYLLGSGWMMIWAFRGRPAESSLSLATVFLGGLLFYGVQLRQQRKTKEGRLS